MWETFNLKHISAETLPAALLHIREPVHTSTTIKDATALPLLLSGRQAEKSLYSY